MHFTKLIPELYYTDIKSALKTFVDCLEFRIGHDELNSTNPFCVLDKDGMSIMLFRNYFRNLPSELFDAAFVDGCGYLRFFWHISLPLSRPIIATVGIISFVGSWNSYILPLIMLNSESRYPWPLGIMVYKGEFSTDWQLILAFITLTILPTIIVFFLAQKHIIAGLTAGAVKS